MFYLVILKIKNITNAEIQKFEPSFVLPKLKVTERVGYTIKFILLLLGVVTIVLLLDITFINAAGLW